MNDFLAIIMVVLIFAVIFILTRSLMLWYWRINEMFDEMYEIKKYLFEQTENQKKIIELLQK